MERSTVLVSVGEGAGLETIEQSVVDVYGFRSVIISLDGTGRDLLVETPVDRQAEVVERVERLGLDFSVLPNPRVTDASTMSSPLECSGKRLAGTLDDIRSALVRSFLFKEFGRGSKAQIVVVDSGINPVLYREASSSNARLIRLDPPRWPAVDEWRSAVYAKLPLIPSPHGTKVAVTANRIAPGASLLDARCNFRERSSERFMFDVIAALNRVAERAKGSPLVVNLSSQIVDKDLPESEEEIVKMREFLGLQYSFLERKGFLVVVAAGNCVGCDRACKPAHEPGRVSLLADHGAVLAVGSSTIDGKALAYSPERGKGGRPDVFGPSSFEGPNVAGFSRYWGTSFAAPIISGLAALALSAFGTRSVVAVKETIREAFGSPRQPFRAQLHDYRQGLQRLSAQRP